MSSFRHLVPAALLCLSAAPAAVAQHVAPPTAARIERSVAAGEKSATRLASVPTEQYSHGDPTPQEQLVLEMINRARANPAAEGVRLVTTNDPAVRGAYEFFQIDTGLVRSQFATYPSRPPLAFNAKLIAAARRHTEDMRLNNYQGHVGTDGSAFDARIRDAGYTSYTALGENVSAYAHNLWYSHAGFNVDWGNPDLGHRHNIMNFGANDAVFTEFGAGVADLNRPPQQGQVGPIIVTQEFARNSDGPFLLGVVYFDANSNGLYDIGEGLSGVRVTPSTGTYYAVTSTSGGYAIPVKSAGSSFEVTFSGGPLAFSYTRPVTIVNGQNVKLDLTPTAAPGAVTTLRPAANTVVPSDTVRFVWRRPTGTPDRYRLIVATDEAMTSVVRVDSTITDTVVTRSGFQNDQRYYWQVQAHNGAGWGELSPPQSFRVLRLPSAPTLIVPAANDRVLRSNVRFIWTRPAGPVDGYTFELARDPGMASMVLRDTTVSDTVLLVPSIDVDRLYWRVRAKNESGWGAYSEIRLVEGVTSGIEIGATGRSDDELRIVSLHPNPVLDAAPTMVVALPKSGEVSIDVVDPQGRIVESILPATEHAAGELTIRIPVEELQHGVYFVRVRTADDAIAAPFQYHSR